MCRRSARLSGLSRSPGQWIDRFPGVRCAIERGVNERGREARQGEEMRAWAGALRTGRDCEGGFPEAPAAGRHRRQHPLVHRWRPGPQHAAGVPPRESRTYYHCYFLCCDGRPLASGDASQHPQTLFSRQHWDSPEIHLSKIIEPCQWMLPAPSMPPGLMTLGIPSPR
jgi:hypothetical protein